MNLFYNEETYKVNALYKKLILLAVAYINDIIKQVLSAQNEWHII